MRKGRSPYLSGHLSAYSASSECGTLPGSWRARFISDLDDNPVPTPALEPIPSKPQRQTPHQEPVQIQEEPSSWGYGVMPACVCTSFVWRITLAASSNTSLAAI